MGIDRGEIPDLAKAPNSLLEALEAHLASLEGTKSAGGSRVTSPTGTGPTMHSAIQQLSNMTDRIGAGGDVFTVDESIKQKYLLDEQERLNALKASRLLLLASMLLLLSSGS